MEGDGGRGGGKKMFMAYGVSRDVRKKKYIGL